MVLTQYSEQKIKRIRHIAKKNDKKILELLGIVSFQGPCPVHKGDNPTAFSYSRDRKCWSCFSHHCEQEYGNDIIGLICGIMKIKFPEALKLIEDKFISGDNNIDWKQIDNDIEEQLYIQTRVIPNKILDETSLKRLVPDFSTIKDRGFKKETLRFFESGVPKKFVPSAYKRLYISIRDDCGRLVGFTGRSLYPKDEETGFYFSKANRPPDKYLYLHKKWMNIPKGFQKSLVLYNLNNAREYIKQTNTAIIVEGPFDVWRLWENNIKNVVSPMGTTISRHQIDLLKKYDCINIILMFDPDNAGEIATEKSKKKLDECFKVYTPSLDNDPCDLSQDKYNRYIKPFIEQIYEVSNG